MTQMLTLVLSASLPWNFTLLARDLSFRSIL